MILEQALSRTELVKRRFRHVAQRSFMILRRYRGRERSPERMQISAERLLDVLMHLDPEHPVVRETFREILEDYMDVERATWVLEGIRSNRIKLVIRGPLPYPSPMAHHLVVKGYSDVVLMEDRRRLLAILHDRIMEILSSMQEAI